MSPAMAQQTWPFLPMFRRNPTGHGLFSCLFLSVFLYTSALSAQDISAVKKDSLVADQLELDSTWKGKPDISGVAFNNFHIGNNWDLLLTPAQKKRRTWLIGGANVVGYGGTMIGLYSAWYKNYPQTKFHTFNDWQEWKQVDKVGHFYSAYIESMGSTAMWRWAGMERKKRIWIGGMSGAVYQTVIEVLDGFSAGWGWSWGDFTANMLGSGTFVAQELAWNEQRIKFKFSFHRKTYNDPELNQRSDKLFGQSLGERLIKDYNGQTYWASANLKSFFKNSHIPEWLSVSVGYGAEGLFGGTQNIAKDENGNITFNRPDIKRYRQWFLAPDIDFTKIRTNKKGLRFLFTVLSAFKFPAPSLEYGNGKLRLHAIHF
jgi:uncharacterized protein YfiM (DUF2279 family)